MFFRAEIERKLVKELRNPTREEEVDYFKNSDLSVLARLNLSIDRSDFLGIFNEFDEEIQGELFG